MRDDRPLEATEAEVLAAVHRALTAADCPYFLVGAMGGDLLLSHVFGLAVYRVTQDFDFGAAVDSWDRFAAVKQAIVRGGFEAHPRIAHRLLYKRDDNEHSFPIDVIPFGGVATPEGTLAWPPDADFIMTVTGFDEALAAAVHVHVGADLDIPVASLAGLTLLKFFAWRDRHAINDKDATDLYRLMSSYGDAGNVDRLYGGELRFLEATGFDLPIAGARLLGHDTARICAGPTQNILGALLADVSVMERLSEQMAGRRGWKDEAHQNSVSRLLYEFRNGFQEFFEARR
jgi:predicted nucleotidyltransferase